MMSDTELRLTECRSRVVLSIQVLEGTLGITPALPITLPLLNACQQLERTIREGAAK